MKNIIISFVIISICFISIGCTDNLTVIDKDHDGIDDRIYKNVPIKVDSINDAPDNRLIQIEGNITFIDIIECEYKNVGMKHMYKDIYGNSHVQTRTKYLHTFTDKRGNSIQLEAYNQLPTSKKMVMITGVLKNGMLYI